MIFQHAKIHRDESLRCLCVACYEGEILNYEDHVFAISCCIATLIQDARDRRVAVEPLLREYLGAEPEPGLLILLCHVKKIVEAKPNSSVMVGICPRIVWKFTLTPGQIPTNDTKIGLGRSAFLTWQSSIKFFEFVERCLVNFQRGYTDLLPGVFFVQQLHRCVEKEKG